MSMNSWLLQGVRRYPGSPEDRFDLRIDDGVIVRWSAAGHGDRSGARILDLTDLWLLPAFVDSHQHLLYSMQHSRQMSLADREAADVVELLKSHGGVGTSDLNSWIGHGWKDPLPQLLLPDPRRFLDECFPGTSVFLWNSDHHRALVSSRALREAGFESDRHDGIVTEEDAEKVWAAMERGEAGDAGQAARWLLEQGIAAVTTFDRGDSIAILQEEASRQDLGVRIRHGLPEEEFLGAIEADAFPLPVGDRQSPFAMRWIKIFIDGTLGSRTAWMKSDYRDEPGQLGCVRRSSVDLDETARLAAKGGWALAIHAIGDAAVKEANRVIGLTRSLRSTPLPDRIEHFQCFDPSDLAWIQETGTIASMQPCHLYQDRAILLERWGDRAANALALKSVDEAGIPLILGSDSPIESADPWLDIDAAVRRLPLDGAGEAFFSEQCVPFEKAFHWRSAGAAQGNWLPTGWGTLDEGTAADFQVIAASDPASVRRIEEAGLLDVFSLGSWRLGRLDDDAS